MPNNDYIPAPDQQYVAWLTNFVNVCSADDAILGLDAAELKIISDAAMAFKTSLTESDASKAIYRAKVTDKDDFRRQVTAIVRKYAREFKANSTIPNRVLTNLGIVINNTAGPVSQVTGLQVTGCADGVNKLTWNRNGNAPNTIFIIEYKPENETNWGFAAAITKTSFNHLEQTPGELVWYRIIASRAGVNAVASLPVAAYGGYDSAPLNIAA